MTDAHIPDEKVTPAIRANAVEAVEQIIHDLRDRRGLGKYPSNCDCCPPNLKAFRAVKADAERMQREHREDLERMERAADSLENMIRENTALAKALGIAKTALTHRVPSDCWATGPATGDPIEDYIVCPGCRALNAIDESLSALSISQENGNG